MAEENVDAGGSMAPLPESGIGDGSTPYAGWGDSVEIKQEGKKRRKRTRALPEAGGLSINSLMDIVTILLVYLIKSYATSPIEVKDPSLNLPTSTTRENVEEAAVVMVTGPVTKTLDAAGNPVPKENTPTLIVDGTPLFPLTPIRGANNETSWRIPDNQKTGGFVVNSLKASLEEARKTQEMAAELTDREFSGKVVILADKQTPYRVLMDLLVTCGQAGFGEFKFAVVKDEGG